MIAEPTRPVLVAHRGWSGPHPENTLASIEAALKAGATWVEFDVQMTADGVVVLLHDATLRRTAGIKGRVHDLDLQAVRRVVLTGGERIPTLDELVTLLAGWPAAQALLEVKPESVRRFGAERVTDAVLDAIAPIAERCVVISYDPAVVERARARARIGWVLPRYGRAARRYAESLRPDYLVCNQRRVGRAALWPGPWQWVLYDAATAQHALDLAARGASLVETRLIGELLADPRLRAATPEAPVP